VKEELLLRTPEDAVYNLGIRKRQHCLHSVRSRDRYHLSPSEYHYILYLRVV
jgi:hypothetical protein